MITRRVGMLHHPPARLLALLAPCIVAIQPSDTYGYPVAVELRPGALMDFLNLFFRYRLAKSGVYGYCILCTWCAPLHRMWMCGDKHKNNVFTHQLQEQLQTRPRDSPR